jgi:hypothetical protein
MSLVKEQFVQQSVEESRMGVQRGRKPLTVVGVLSTTLLVFFAIVSIGLAG